MVTTTAIATEIGMGFTPFNIRGSKDYKLQQLIKLLDNKIIQSVSGPNGGFFMSQKSKDLPVRNILKAMGEDATLNKCVLGLAKCSDVKPCPMHAEYKLIKNQLIELFDRKTINDLQEDLNRGDVFIKK